MRRAPNPLTCSLLVMAQKAISPRPCRGDVQGGVYLITWTITRSIYLDAYSDPVGGGIYHMYKLISFNMGVHAFKVCMQELWRDLSSIKTANMQLVCIVLFSFDTYNKPAHQKPPSNTEDAFQDTTEFVRYGTKAQWQLQFSDHTNKASERRLVCFLRCGAQVQRQPKPSHCTASHC